MMQEKSALPVFQNNHLTDLVGRSCVLEIASSRRYAHFGQGFRVLFYLLRCRTYLYHHCVVYKADRKSPEG